MKADQLHDDSAVVLLSTHGLDRRAGEALRRFLQGGGGVFVAAAPDVDAAVLSVLFDWTPVLEPLEVEHAGVLAATDLRHPVLRPFDAVAANFGQVAFDHAWRIDGRGPWRVVARFTNGDPALAERTGGPGRLLLFTSDVDRRWNDFPLPAAVPPRPGLVERDGRTIAVNVDPRESRVERVTPAEFRSLVTRTAAPVRARAARLATDTERQQHYWRYGLMLMLVALVLEAFIGSR